MLFSFLKEVAMKPWLVCILLAPAILRAAEGEPFRYKGSGYGFFTAGACQHSYALVGAGGGAEGFIWRGLTVGAEGGYQSFTDGGGWGALYFPVGYHAVDRNKHAKWDPFVSFAVGLFYGGGGSASAAAHFGGGGTYWFRKRVGVRTELRVHGYAGDEVTVQGRVGIAFR